MALRLRDIALGLEEDEAVLPLKAARELGLAPADLFVFRIVRKAVDARKKPRVLRVYTVEFELKDEAVLLARLQDHPRLEQVVPLPTPTPLPSAQPQRILVVGMGPAGLFAALQLARCGHRVILVERGKPMEERVKDVRRFWAGEGLLAESNVQFGEGGAGTFSDGKLTTRVNHPWIRYVLETLVACGAPEEILQQAKPHVGTDRLRLVLLRLRQQLLDLGVEIRYSTRLTGLLLSQGRVCGGVLNAAEELLADFLLLAPGHSARDTYDMLARLGVALESKPFAIGVRVEHPSALINQIQYGHRKHPRLPAAEYALAWNDPETGRGVYSFCMCPGGEVVIASSEPDGVVVNGMSSLSRGSDFSNSALVVGVRREDFPGTDPLAGVRFQQQWERQAFVAGGCNQHAPAQNLLAFLGRGGGAVGASCRPGVREAALDEVLPAFVCQGLRRALPQFDKRMRGFVTAEATLIGVETRTSAPLRILRGEDGQSLSHPGLYPAGEGAGYAGGIMSAALDGLRVAEKITTHILSKTGVGH